jgi:transcription initiation factor TFIIIB Brf1 subunit/transcription initiation factor TFIIB
MNKEVALSYRCPNCGSINVYYRVRRQEFICRRCGATWTAVKKKVSEAK